MSEAPGTTSWTTQSFREALGQALYRINKAQRMRTSDFARVLNGYGIPQPTVTGDQVTFDFSSTERTLPFGYSGVKWDDLSAEAQARIEAEETTHLRRNAYSDLVSGADYGTYPKKAVLKELEGLGFPKPTQVTDVRARVVLNGQPKLVATQVDGTMTVEEATEALQAHVTEDTPETALLRAAFGDRAQKLPSPVSHVDVVTHETWADASTIQ